MEKGIICGFHEVNRKLLKFSHSQVGRSVPRSHLASWRGVPAMRPRLWRGAPALCPK